MPNSRCNCGERMVESRRRKQNAGKEKRTTLARERWVCMRTINRPEETGRPSLSIAGSVQPSQASGGTCSCTGFDSQGAAAGGQDWPSSPAIRLAPAITRLVCSVQRPAPRRSCSRMHLHLPSLCYPLLLLAPAPIAHSAAPLQSALLRVCVCAKLKRLRDPAAPYPPSTHPACAQRQARRQPAVHEQHWRAIDVVRSAHYSQWVPPPPG